MEDLDRVPSSLPEVLPTDYNSELETLRERFIAELDKLIGRSANKAFLYMSLYSLGTFILILLDGSGWYGFDLDESVLDLLVGSTAVTVLGLVGMVLTGIFVGARKAVSERA